MLVCATAIPDARLAINMIHITIAVSRNPITALLDTNIRGSLIAACGKMTTAFVALANTTTTVETAAFLTAQAALLAGFITRA